MPTGADGPERTAENRNEQSHLSGREATNALANGPVAYLPPSAQQCGVPEMQQWIDLCA